MHLTDHKNQDSTLKDSIATFHRPLPQQNSFAPITDLSIDQSLQARLSVKFQEFNGTTRLVDREHFGPLCVQKPFYPEGPKVCQVVIVHPPGGVVGGDKLKITTSIGAAANVQITTPGAAKWYKANGHISRQDVKIDVESNGALEWLPQETIFFDNAHVELGHNVTLGKDATYIGCEILCFGRTASGEIFDGGQISQRNSIRRDGKLIWFEQLQLSGGSAAMKSPLVLAGKTVCATLIAAGTTVPASLINSLREETSVVTNGVGYLGVTQLKSVVVVRYLGDSSEIARQVMLSAWKVLRPVMLDRKAIVPRMWNT